ncbi:papain-like cysteine protease family protein [Paenibacillus elgii]
MRKLLSLIVGLTLIVSANFAVAADPAPVSVQTAAAGGATVPNVQQKMSNWCWAGVSVPILQHYGKFVSQEEFVRYVKGGLYNAPATTGEIMYGLKRYGVNSSDFYYLPTLQWVQNEVNGRRPMIAFIRWTNGAAIGHFFVLDGYHSGTGGNQYVSYMDPWYGDHYSQTFNSFKSNNRFVWSGTIRTSN